MKFYIFLSAYNGERFIEEQIKSIFWQENVNVEIWIRDDGSSDNTLSILKRLSDNDSRIHLLMGENIGYAKSFMTLVKTAPNDADYYAFCDQDDVWMPDKLSRAQSIIGRKTVPVAYCSCPQYVDEELNPVNADGGFLDRLPSGEIDYRSALFTGLIGLGCTFVWNNELNSIIRSADYSCLPCGHDNFISILSTMVGELYRDDNKSILYRQHKYNSSGNKLKKRNAITIITNRIKNWGQYDDANNLRLFILQNFREFIPEDKQELLDLSVKYSEGIGNKIKFLKKCRPVQLERFFIIKFYITILLNQY